MIITGVLISSINTRSTKLIMFNGFVKKNGKATSAVTTIGTIIANGITSKPIPQTAMNALIIVVWISACCQNWKTIT